MKIIRRTISIILISAIAMSLSACKGSKTDNKEGSVGAETGAWTMNDQKTQAKLPDEAARAFNKATEGFTGSTLEPVALIGSQVVAGLNYMILCRATTATQESVTTYQIAVIYADLEGNAELISLKDFDLSKYTEGHVEAAQEMLSGGWYVPEDACGSDIPENAKAAYEKATEAVCWEWAEAEPIAYLGSQVVAGTNYAILCKGKLTEDSSTNRIFVTTVYEDTEGNAGVANTRLLELAEFTEQ